MAKIPYSKFKIKIEDKIEEVNYEGFNIKIKQYLPIQEKLELISKVINNSHEENYNYSNPVKIKIFTQLELIYAYTDISFTDKQKENITKLYDELYSSGLLSIILNKIPETEKEIIITSINNSIKAVYDYQNSILGILDTISTDYSNLNLNIEELKGKLANSENLDIVKNVVEKLG